jgi:hypothetical protein
LSKWISESEIAQEEEEMNLDDNNYVIVITSQIKSRCLISRIIALGGVNITQNVSHFNTQIKNRINVGMQKEIMN